MSDNPFNSPMGQSPNPYANIGSSTPTSNGGKHPGLGYVNQIPVIATLTLVQGGLILLMSLCMFGYGLFIQFIIEQAAADAGRAVTPHEEQMQTMLFWGGLIGGFLAFLCACMHFFAGYKAFRYESRVLCILTWAFGMGMCLTCYCAPTAVGLLIYGLIIFLNPATTLAFELKQQGLSKAEINQRFY